ncbi:MAG: polysaccharide biosynthesis tyrosine autokinase [Bacteroidia bacterium]|nr:polysaccharide biosynthesis tyrosine autokinase [Bacteroidia bacterium]
MSENINNKENNFKEVIYPYLINWKYFVLSILVFLSIYILYIKYTKNFYKINTSIIINDEKKNGITNQIESFESLGLNFGGSSSSIENEINLLHSRNLISKVTKELKLNITYYNLNSTRKDELYENLPIKINLLDKEFITNNKNASITIKKISSSKFELFDEKKDKIGVYVFGESINSSLGNIIITPTHLTKNKNFHILIQLKKFDDVVTDLIKSINIEKVNKESDILSLSTQSNNINKGKAILKELVEKHIEETVNNKNQVSKNSLEFINERIEFITNELSDVESNVSLFKSENKIFDLTSNATMFFENENENRKNLAENNIQLKLSEFILEHLKNSKNDDLIPYNIGISNPAIDELVSSVNNIIIERNKLLVRSSEKNPIVQNLESQILSLKNNLKESLINQKNTLKIKSRELEKTNEILDQKLTSAPEQEKDFREISRQQQIKETLYIFLLHKREETAISLAVGVSNIKSIDPPFSDGNIVSPKKQILLLGSILIGLIIPIMIIYFKGLLNTKITSKLSILNVNLPYLGDIPLLKKFNDNNKVVITSNSNDSISESFRILRTNVGFLFKKKDLNTKVIFVTSTIEKEGKSFVSLNLANSLALTNKKVILIGMDLRAPKLLDYLGLQNRKGITNYIIDESIDYNDLIIKNHNGLSFDILPSGDIPPNPTELLLNDRVGELFYKLRNKYEYIDQYDYVIVDTAPVAPVADTLLITQHSDAIVYVCRANYLDENLLKIPASLYAENKLPNLAVILNGTEQKSGYGYGNGYGYGYGHLLKKDLPWYKKLFKS